MRLQLQARQQAARQPRRLALHLEAHRREAVALAQQLGHVVEEVGIVLVELLLVHADVGVAGDGDDRLLLDGVDLERLFHVRGDDRLRAHELRRRAGQHQDRRHDLGNVDDADHRLAVLRQQRRGVERLVLQVRKRVAAVDDLRRQQRADVFLIIIVHIGALAVGERFVGDLADAVDGQFAHQLAVDLVAPRDHRAHRLVDARELLRRRQPALVVHIVGREHVQVHEAAHADHEKLVQIAGKDGDKAQPLDQRHGGVRRLGEHALVELQPAQLAVLRVAQVAGLDAIHTDSSSNDNHPLLL